MTLIKVNQQPLSRRPLGPNNSQTPGTGTQRISMKVTASPDSTGVENVKNMMIKHHHSVKKPQTVSVEKRNLRERTRVRGVNDGFGKLKMYVPDMKNKSSKVETLRGAIEYIKRLKEILGEEKEDTSRETVKFEIESINDDSSTFSDTADSSYSNTTNDRLSDIHEMKMHPMVYQLPSSFSYIPAAVTSPVISHLSPILLPPVFSFPPDLHRPLNSTKQISYSSPIANNPLDSIHSPTVEKMMEQLPSMSANAPSWWPHK